ncbi:MAG: glycosyltransferase family 2 protein [Hyphomicrobiaceae bacterium]|nr:MAG: glycosyltransferase family 2 protein [Hyphomicrobiaceae bacterium]
MITVSIVSHGHGAMLKPLVAQLAGFAQVSRIILTRNIPEPLDLAPHPALMLRDNARPMGFGANHNAAFRFCETPYFCVLNPDIALPENPFPALLDCLKRSDAALAAPLVVAPSGEIEDSIRHFPTPLALLQKTVGGADGRYATPVHGQPFKADWVAGMFMLFGAAEFRAVNGFDESFFLYYEDVDICARLWRTGRSVVACPRARAIHAARRTSRRNLRYMAWHVRSMLRYFVNHLGRLPRR